MDISKPQTISLPKITDSRGNLTFIEENKHIPFDIKRIFYLYDVPAQSERDGHGHKKLQQVIIALSGSFEIIIDNGLQKQNFILKKPWEGLYIPPLVWHQLKEFSAGSICLVLASELYSETNYFCNYEEFLKAVNAPTK